VVHRHDHLLSFEAELHGDLLNRVKRGAIHISLTGLTETAIAHRGAKAREEALERCRPTVHGGDLDHLGH
jgi:hypothetical protein